MTALPLIVALLAPSALPQPLTQLLRAARAHNHQIGIARAQLAEQDAAVSQAVAALLPTFQAAGSYTRNQYAAVFSLPPQFATVFGFTHTSTLSIQPYNTWQGQLALNVPVFSATSFSRHRAAENARDAARNGDRATESDVLLETVRAYYQVVGMEGVVEASERAFATARDHLRVTEAKLASGTSDRLAVERAKVDVATADQTVVTSRQALELARRSLETLTGETVAGSLPPPDDADTPSGSEGEYVARAEERRPEIAQLQSVVEQAQSQLAEAWGQLVPMIAANAQEHFTNAPGFIPSNAFYSVGASATWLLDPVGTPASIRRARATLEEQEQRLAETRDMVRDDVHSAWLDADADRARLEQAESASQSARTALQITQEEFQSGTATSLDMSSAERDAFVADATLAQTRANLSAAVLTLQKAAGEPLLSDSSAP